MPVILQQDVFSRVGALGSNWTEFQSAFVLDGDIAHAQSNHGPPPTYTPLEYRAAFDPFDPKATLPQPTTVQPPPGFPTLDMSVAALIRMPDPLPPVGKKLEIAVSMLGSLTPSISHYETLYEIDAAGTHGLFLIRRDFNAAGATTNKLILFSRNLSGAGVALTAGQFATLKLRLVAEVSTQFFLQPSWSVESYIVVNYTLSGNVNALTGYCGMYLRQEGPNNSSGSNLGSSVLPPTPASAPPEFATLDQFTVLDERLGTSLPFFPVPTLVAEPSLTSVSLAIEDQPSGDTLTIEPDYALPIHHRVPSREFRTDDGQLVTHAAGTKTRRTWELRWSGVTTAQRNTLDALAHSTRTGVTNFTWTDPHTSEILKLRALEAVQIEETDKGLWLVTMIVEEVHA